MKSGILLALLVAIMWAVGEVNYSKISKKIDRANVYFYQFAFRTIIYFLVVLIFNNKIIGSFNINTLYIYLPIILCDLFASYVVNIAVSNGKLSTVSPIMASYPIVDILFGLYILDEKISMVENILIIIISISIITLAAKSRKNKKAPHPIKGIFFACIYMFLIALSTLFEKNIYNTSYSIFEFYYYKSLIYFLVSAIFGLVIFISPKKLKKPNKEIIRGTGLTPIGNVIYSFALLYGNMVVVTPVSSIYSSLASILSIKVLKEEVSIKEGICIAAILLSTLALIVIGFI